MLFCFCLNLSSKFLTTDRLKEVSVARFHIDEEGFVWRNEIAARLTTSSYFGGEKHPLMHFHGYHWDRYDVSYPEVLAEEVKGDDFCWPHGGQCEFDTLPDSRIRVRAYHIAVNAPVLEIIFPNPEMCESAIYVAFMRPTDREIRDRVSDESIHHMREMRQIEIYIGYIPGTLLLEIGMTRRRVNEMTAYARIGVLEQVYRLNGVSRRLPADMFGKMERFLQGIDRHDFRTDADY